MTSWAYSLKTWLCYMPRACSKGLRLDEDTTMRPFEGLKVLDFFWVVIGPMTTSYLVEYGATVVRIESRGRPEVLRTAPPFGGGQRGLNRSAYYANYNVNKYGFGLNMGHPKAMEIVKRFVPWADVVTENFTPGTMEKWGLGYEVLRALKPDLIMISASMLGHGGPYSRQPGFGPVLASLSGMTDLTGWPDRDPSTPYGAYTDFVVPRFALPTLLAALDYRRRTGQGQYIDISQLEAALHFMAPRCWTTPTMVMCTPVWGIVIRLWPRMAYIPVRARIGGAPLPARPRRNGRACAKPWELPLGPVKRALPACSAASSMKRRWTRCSAPGRNSMRPSR